MKQRDLIIQVIWLDERDNKDTKNFQDFFHIGRTRGGRVYYCDYNFQDILPSLVNSEGFFCDEFLVILERHFASYLETTEEVDFIYIPHYRIGLVGSAQLMNYFRNLSETYTCLRNTIYVSCTREDGYIAMYEENGTIQSTPMKDLNLPFAIY
jgi:hypothetical protein